MDVLCSSVSFQPLRPRRWRTDPHLARVADDAGLDLIGIQDHPYQRRFLDTWMLMATVLANTQQVRVFPDVANLPLRPPAVMAKAAASLDVLSGGRFELGLGAGGFWTAIAAMGGPARTPGEAVGALGGGDQGHPVDVVGRAVGPVRGSALPPGRCEARPPAGPRHGDMARRRGPTHPRPWWAERLTDGCRRAGGRRRTSSPTCTPGSTTPHSQRDGIQRRFVGSTTCGARSTGPAEFLNGSAGQWVDELTELAVDRGMDTFVFGPSADPVPQLQRFANEIAPVVREQVAQQRGG